MTEPAQGRVLFVDDNADLRGANVQALELAGLDAVAFADARAALAAIDVDFNGVVVTDVRMPEMDGLELFTRVRAIDSEIPVILITGHADVPMAVSATRDGAFDFLTKPFASDRLIAAVRSALKTRSLVVENRSLREAADHGDSPLIGDSPPMKYLRETIGQVARADVDVMIEGETGTGKELVARLLHRQGPRRGRPFIAINCGALPENLAEIELFGRERGLAQLGQSAQEGYIARSDGGTLFLDEIDSMPPSIQTRLLRVLEEREILPVGADTPRMINLHVVAAAKGDALELVRAGRLREDLYYRLNVARLRVRPLRERRRDIPMLFAHFTQEALEQTGIKDFTVDDAMRAHMIEHDWPGNVRELRNFAFNAVLGLWPETESTGTASASNLSLSQRVDSFEANALREALEHCHGDIRSAMELLQLPRKTLYDKMAKHGISPDAYRPGK